MSVKYNRWIYLAVFACLGLEYWFYQPFDILAQLKRTNQYNYAAITDMLGALGFAPHESAIGVGHFRLEQLPNLSLHVPREFIRFLPKQPSGETTGLNLSFFLPDMASRRAFDKRLRHLDQKQLRQLIIDFEVSVRLSAKEKYIQCWGGQCLGPEFARFQLLLNAFQPQSLNAGQFENIQTLKDGDYDPKLDLIVYHSPRERIITADQTVGVDTLYLKPGADPRHPGEWIHCERYICQYDWFRDGLYIDTSFQRSLLPIHSVIRTQLDQIVDTFIEHAN